VTDAFRAYWELSSGLESYPILNDEDYSRREYEATLENIGDAAYSITSDYNLPDGWEGEVYSWFSDNEPGAIENRDDQGGYPSDDEMRSALDGLGYERIVEDWSE
jgi:hypothetical protein